MEDERFKIRSYGWGELALRYSPSLQAGSAARLLRSWVVRNEELSHALEAAGVRRRQRVLTPRQVGLIVRHLGEP